MKGRRECLGKPGQPTMRRAEQADIVRQGGTEWADNETLDAHDTERVGNAQSQPRREALEDQVQAVLSGRAKPDEAMASAQREADALMRPYVEQTALRLPE